MKYLIPYLGFDSYFYIFDYTKVYHSAKNPGYRIDGVGNEDDFDLKEDFNEVLEETGGDEEEIKERNIDNSLKHLDDPLAKELFVSIIKLIRYFCSQAIENQKNKLFKAISDTLN